MKKKSVYFSQDPSCSQIATFSLGQKGCDYLGKCDYLGCDYYEWGQNFFGNAEVWIILNLNINAILIQDFIKSYIYQKFQFNMAHCKECELELLANISIL